MNPCRKTIGWADFTWNIVVGCRKCCSYCYAKRMNDRFHFIPIWTNPVFFHDRLIEPYQLTKPSIIFVGSMCDLFGDWICRDWIKEVLYISEHNPQHTFMFLTKNPKRYLDFDFPKNVMLGCTITHDGENAIMHRDIMKRLKMKRNRTFVSIEPIHSSFEGISFAMFDLVIVGAETGPKPIIPQPEWILSIIHPNIYYKNNLIKYFPDLNNDNYELQRKERDNK
jgi:protein gp37